MNISPQEVVTFLSDVELPDDHVVGVDAQGHLVAVAPNTPEADRAEKAYRQALDLIRSDPPNSPLVLRNIERLRELHAGDIKELETQAVEQLEQGKSYWRKLESVFQGMSSFFSSAPVPPKGSSSSSQVSMPGWFSSDSDTSESSMSPAATLEAGREWLFGSDSSEGGFIFEVDLHEGRGDPSFDSGLFEELQQLLQVQSEQAMIRVGEDGTLRFEAKPLSSRWLGSKPEDTDPEGAAATMDRIKALATNIWNKCKDDLLCAAAEDNLTPDQTADLAELHDLFRKVIIRLKQADVGLGDTRELRQALREVHREIVAAIAMYKLKGVYSPPDWPNEPFTDVLGVDPSHTIELANSTPAILVPNDIYRRFNTIVYVMPTSEGTEILKSHAADVAGLDREALGEKNLADCKNLLLNLVGKGPLQGYSLSVQRALAEMFLHAATVESNRLPATVAKMALGAMGMDKEFDCKGGSNVVAVEHLENVRKLRITMYLPQKISTFLEPTPSDTSLKGMRRYFGVKQTIEIDIDKVERLAAEPIAEDAKKRRQQLQTLFAESASVSIECSSKRYVSREQLVTEEGVPWVSEGFNVAG